MLNIIFSFVMQWYNWFKHRLILNIKRVGDHMFKFVQINKYYPFYAFKCNGLLHTGRVMIIEKNAET